MKNLDIVYYYLNNNSEELKYSIRSAVKNLNVDRIFLVGDKPKWFKETSRSIYIKSNISFNKTGLGSVPILHLISLVKSGKCPDEFLMFNDDFFIMKKIDKWLDYYRDEDDYQRKAAKNYHYHLRTLRSLTFCNGSIEGRKYNLHIPMKIKKSEFEEFVEIWKTLPKKDIDFRTFYGNLYIKSDSPLEDVKISTNKFIYSGETFLSTNKESFDGEVGDLIKSTFTEPSFVEMI